MDAGEQALADGPLDGELPLAGHHQQGLAVGRGGVRVQQGAHHAVHGAAHGGVLQGHLGFLQIQFGLLHLQLQVLNLLALVLDELLQLLLGVAHVVVVVAGGGSGRGLGAGVVPGLKDLRHRFQRVPGGQHVLHLEAAGQVRAVQGEGVQQLAVVGVALPHLEGGGKGGSQHVVGGGGRAVPQQPQQKLLGQDAVLGAQEHIGVLGGAAARVGFGVHVQPAIDRHVSRGHCGLRGGGRGGRGRGRRRGGGFLGGPWGRGGLPGGARRGNRRGVAQLFQLVLGVVQLDFRLLHGDVLGLHVQLQLGLVILEQGVAHADLLALGDVDVRDGLLGRGVNLLGGVAGGRAGGIGGIPPIGGGEVAHRLHLHGFLVRLVLHEKPKAQGKAHHQHSGDAGDYQVFPGFLV